MDERLRIKCHRNLKVGDVVIIKRENPIRSSWTLGCVTSVYPSSDGFVRNVDVKYKSEDGINKFEIIRRPVQRLILLAPVDEENEQN